MDESKIRTTISMTKAQAAYASGVSLVAAIGLVLAVQKMFYTRTEGVNLGEKIAEVKAQVEKNATEMKANNSKEFADLRVFIVQGSEDQMHKLERLNDKLIERIKDNEVRTARAEDKMEHRIDTVEAAVLSSKNGPHKKSSYE